MNFKNYFLMLLLAVFAINVSAQEATPNVPGGTDEIGTFHKSFVAPSIQSLGAAPEMEIVIQEARDRRSLSNTVVIGKDRQTQDDYFVRNRHETEGSVRVAPPTVVFDAYISGSQPTDPAMAIGPDHVFVVFNTGFAIYDKSGNDVGGGQRPVTDIFSGGGCCDLTASYDQAANRWVLSYLWSSNGQIQVAVSDGPDPVNDTWSVYTIPGVQDYNKLSVWSDGYYVTRNGSTNKVWALERDKMIAGDPAASFQSFILPGMVTSGFASPQVLNVSDSNMPAAGGAPVLYMQDDAWSGVTTDHIKLWTIDVDWTTPANSTVSAATQLPATPFISVFDGGNWTNFSQPGGGGALDALQATIMNQAQFRKMSGYNSALFNFVVDADAGGGKLGAIRWFELRQDDDNQPWSVYQEGTYTAPNGKHAWNASLIMNGDGDIGMGYTAMAGPTTTDPTNNRVGSYYTGRLAGDANGVMSVTEEVIGVGSGNIPGNRYGDYSKIDIDPADDTTFWFIDEYYNSGRKGIVGAFTLGAPQADDIGVTAITAPNSGPLGAAENVTVSIKNFGSNDIMNPEVQYILDGGSAEVENYAGTIAAGATESYTFTATGDFSVAGNHTIVAKTNLSGDTNTGNDEFTKTVNTGADYCTPTATAGCNLDGIKKFVLNTIDADDGGVGCNTEPASSPQGYADRTNLSTDLSNVSGSNVYTLQAQQNWAPETDPPFTPGDEGFAVWIDFDDSGSFEPSELLIDSAFQLSAELEDFTLTIPVGAALGAHRLRAKAMDITGAGTLTDPCEDVAYGEIQDYTVVIVDILGVEDPAISEAEFTVVTLPNNQFDITLITGFDGVASIAVYNVLGQTLAYNNLEKEGDSYVYHLDMSYADTGVYFIKMGDNSSKTYKTAKIIVK